MPLPSRFERSPWGLVVVQGPDATSFLQAIVSQDLLPVAVGQTVPSLLLHPQGKLEVTFRATRRPSPGGADPESDGGPADPGDGVDVWWLDTDPAYATRLAESLGRYRIRVKADIEDRTAETAMASVVGTAEPASPVPAATATIPARWGRRPGFDVLGPAVQVREWGRASGIEAGDDAALEVLRIEAGVPRLGIDIDDSTIPQEAFLETDAVSFTKGCFIGQELVCRIDSRGHVNRFLRPLSIPGVAVPPAGATVTAGEKAVGQVTSAAAVPGEDRVVALAMIRREVEPPAEVTVGWAGTTVPARVT